MNEKKYRVAILMATYNGAKYIEKQIQSILDQSYDNWSLFVSDDNSNDNTIGIINKFRDSRINVRRNGGQRGAFSNFYSLLKMAQKELLEIYDYFLLCDQDDIWDKKKIEMQLASFLNQSDQRPTLVYSDLCIINEKDEEVGFKISDMYNIQLDNPWTIFFNPVCVWGNSVGFDRDLLSKINLDYRIHNDFSHDQFLAFNAVAFGKMIYINKPLVNYRRHTENVSSIKRQGVISKLAHIVYAPISSVNNHAKHIVNVLMFIDNTKIKVDYLTVIKRQYTRGGFKTLQFIRKNNIVLGTNQVSVLANKMLLFFKLYMHTDVYKKYLRNSVK